MSEIDADMWAKEIESERQEHNELYEEQAKRIVEPLDWEHYYATHRPAHEPGGELYGLDVRILMDAVDSILDDRPRDIRILDYACGVGEFSVALAQRGYSVKGFDISDKGIVVAQGLANRYRVADKAEFAVANAQELPYEDGEFDLVIGKAVLHHIIKYRSTADELYRVLKPGGLVVFCEGAATNPFIRFSRRFTMIEELGDVPLTAKGLRNWAHKFKTVRIDGYFFLYMLKRLGYSWNNEKRQEQNGLGRSPLFRLALRAGLALDRLFINGRPWSETLGGRYFIYIVK